MHSLYRITILSTLFSIPISGCQDIPDFLPVETAGQPDNCPGCGTTGDSVNTDDSGQTTGEGSNPDTTQVPDSDFTTEEDRCVDPDDPDAPVVEVNGDLWGDHKWSCNKIYVLNTIITVRAGALQIRAGTTVKGKAGSALVIEKDARLYAEGRPSRPVVFTSDQAVGNRSRGDWGGLVFLGRAPTNAGTDLPAEGFATPRTFGGDNPRHSCGSLEYVRVEWAGYELSPDQELNGITFYACGSFTRVDHVQSHMSLDDGIEWFGGGFDASNIIVTGAKDDALDFDLGFQGRLQSVFIHQDPNLGDHAVEVSGGASINKNHITRPQIANLTHIAPGTKDRNGAGFRLSDGAHLRLYNTITLNNHPFVFGLSDQASIDTMLDGRSFVAGSIINTVIGSEALFSIPNDITPFPAEDLIESIKDEDRENKFERDVSLPSQRWGSPFIRPPAHGLASHTSIRLPRGFRATQYCGAVDPRSSTDWTQESWVSYAVN